MPKFAVEPSTRNFYGGSKSNTKFAAEPSMVKSSSGGSQSNFQGTFSGKNTAVPSSIPAASTTTSVGSTSRSSEIQSFKCGGHGHISKECTNTQVIIVNDDGKYETASEEGIEEEAHGDEDLVVSLSKELLLR